MEILRFIILRLAFPVKNFRSPFIAAVFLNALACLCIVVFVSMPVCAQSTNPVDREVANPLTDTPNINPLAQDQPPRPRLPVNAATSGDNAAAAANATAGDLSSLDRVDVAAGRQTVSGPKEARVFLYEGNVDVHVGTYRLQADKVTVTEATNRLLAEGNVVFDQEPGQRITGSRADFNYASKTGYFLNSTGFTNQTQDGTVIYFTADRVDKVSGDTIIAMNAEITACEDNVPKWSFRSKRAAIKLNDRVRITKTSFRVKGLPVVYLPFASVSIKKQDRASGFLSPTFSGSGNKGFRFSNAYYQTLGRSADITFRNDIYTSRGIGFGAELRTRASSRSFFNIGFYNVKDRIFGAKASVQNPNQGGSSFTAEGVNYFKNGFTAVADVNITSNLAFRQVFSDLIQQVISPLESSQIFVNKNFGDYSFNVLARTQVTSLQNTRIRTRELPSITLDKRPSALARFKRVPVYFSFEGGLEGVSRKETADNIGLFRQETGGDPLFSPSIVQRLDVHPRFSVPFNYNGWSVTAMGGLRGTFYSNSLDPATRIVFGRDVTRGYGEFELDVRPPALARNFARADGSFRFRHVIEPYILYRRIGGINNFERIIRFDTTDAIADTNEIEYGLTNRFFTRRSTENVSDAATRASATSVKGVPLSSQPYEALTVTIRGKYFFDPYFGGALVPGRRNQFYPINDFSGFTYGGVPRRFSPINIQTRYRPSRELFADARLDLDTQGGGVRDTSLTFGFSRPLIQVFQSFYYERAVQLVPSLRRFADARGLEPGTLRGSQFSPAVFIGNRERGAFGGVSFFFDFQNRPVGVSSPLVRSSVITAGYAFDCCAVTIQDNRFNAGLRNENRVVFSFRLNGIGTFGTEQFGQRFR
ncbi:MAG: LPS-assembly protein LptD [Pyrinomonadaceae bacterium]